MLKGSSGVSRRSQLGHTEAPGQRLDRTFVEVAPGEGVRGELSWSRREPIPNFMGSFCMLDIRKGKGGEILKEDCRMKDRKAAH